MPKLNKPAKPGYRYEHPNETSGRSYVPHPKEDTPRSQRSDVERMRRGVSPTARSAANKSVQRAAGARALARTAGRAGAIGAAGLTGWDIGRAIDEHTGVGKKLVEKSGLGKIIDKTVNARNPVKLTPKAEKRRKSMEENAPPPGTIRLARGGAITRGDGVARKGRTKGRYI